MNKYFRLEPEVAGQLGPNTVMEMGDHPVVYKLHYEFDGWLGDDILESFPCFICTERLALKIEHQKLTGYTFDKCEISKSELFKEIYSNRELPFFYWLKITGTSIDDFTVDSKGSLLISEKGLMVMKEVNIDHCKIEEI